MYNIQGVPEKKTFKDLKERLDNFFKAFPPLKFE